MSAPRPKVGEVWQDKDPRGGPTFRVESVDDAEFGFAHVVNLNGKRPRRIRLSRFGSYEMLKACPPSGDNDPGGEA